MATINVTVKDRVTAAAIVNGNIVLYDTVNNTQTTVQTNSLGVASFTNVPIGSYSVYNTYISPDATPPTVCGFPSGYTGTTYPRRTDVDITTAGQTVAVTFNFDKPVPWSTINGGNPPNVAFTLAVFVNLANGASSPITPNVANNGMGYNLADNLLYGSSGRSDTTTTVALNYPFTYTTSNVIGDCDADGHFYTLAAVASFTCIDVDPTRTTYLRPLNPYTGFSEVTTSPYTVSFTNSSAGVATNDWSYVPKVSSIVSMSSTNTLFVLSLTTPRARNLAISGPALVAGGVTYSDNSNFYLPTGTQINKYFMTDTIGIGRILASSTSPSTGDGARAVSAAVFYAQAIPHKKVSENYGVTGDTLIYTVTVANNGTTTATDAYFQDTLPDGTTFIADTVYLNGVQQPTGTTPDLVQIGTMPVGEVFTITFNAQLVTGTLPSVSNQANINTNAYDSATVTTINTTFSSNIVTTTLVNPGLVPTKQVDKAQATIGDTLTYTISYSNTGNTTITSCLVLDTTPNGTTFVTNSLRVNGTTITGGTLYPTAYNIGTIPLNGSSTITFKVTVVSIPNPNPIPNSSFNTFNFLISGTLTGTSSASSNTVDTQIVYASLGGLTKSVNKAFATCGEIVTYTIVATNSGNTTAQDIVIKDTIPNGTVFVVNSVFVNGAQQTGANPATGVTIPSIAAGATGTLSFSVKVQC